LKLTNLSGPALSFLLALGTSTSVVVSAAVIGAPVIGMTSGQSGVILDNAKVGSDATLFDGSTVQTTTYSRIHLNDGTRLDLGADSKAQVFARRATLEIGTTEVQSASGYEIDTQTLKIRPTEASLVARIRVESGNRVFVTALKAPVNVLNRDGMLVARVNPGLPVSFLPQAAGAGAYDKTGCVLEKSGAAILVDQSGNEVVELRGSDLRKAVGNQTRITGSIDPSATPAGGSSQVVEVIGVAVTRKGGCSSVAAKIGAATTAGGLAAAAAGAGAAGTTASGGAAGAVTGISATGVVVFGVAAAAAVGLGSAAAVGAFSSSSP
jgi:hypothetical protein